MCGIAGIERKLSDCNIAALEPVLKHRGPDYTGFFQDQRFSFIHWRLSILDLSPQANQPFYFEHLVLIYNGEIYNYSEIAEELKQQGYTFQTTSDTEVLIKAYHCWGVQAFSRFIGMFAFAIYNRQSGELLLVRDRMGVKPLYYLISNGLAFASELKFFKKLNTPLTLNNLAVHQYFRFGFIPGELSIFSEVKKLLPGHYLHYHNNGKTSVHTWYNPPATDQHKEPEQYHDYANELEKLLTSAFKYRLVADVPVGVFLSGGIDSSLLAAVLSRNAGVKINTFTIGFDDARYDERNHARQVAHLLNTEHTDLECSINDARQLFEEFYQVYDEPFADTSGIPTTLVARLAKQNGVKVVLSADGADELFGGYGHYMRVNSWYHNLNAWPSCLRHALASMLGVSIPGSLRKHLKAGNLGHRISRLEELLQSQNAVEFFEAAISNQTQRSVAELTGTGVTADPLLQDFTSDFQTKMMQWDARFYLPDDLLVKIDRATMYVSIEAREPFLDHRIAEFAAQLPLQWKINGHIGKHILRQILFRHLPPHVFDRPKQGFSIPVFKWFSGNLNYLAKRYLQQAAENPVLNPKTVALELQKFQYYARQNKEYNVEKAWRIISFLMWYEKWNR